VSPILKPSAIPLLTLDEVAHRLGVTREQVLVLAEHGPLVAIEGNTEPHVTQLDLETFLAHHMPKLDQLRAVA
jgi:hypothetical protein